MDRNLGGGGGVPKTPCFDRVKGDSAYTKKVKSARMRNSVMSKYDLLLFFLKTTSICVGNLVCLSCLFI